MMDPPNGIVRYEWLELLVRIAKGKFIEKPEPPLCETVKDAIIMFIDKHIKPLCDETDRVTWREN